MARSTDAPEPQKADDKALTRDVRENLDNAAEGDPLNGTSPERKGGDGADSRHFVNHSLLAPEQREKLQVRAGWSENSVPAVLPSAGGIKTAQTNPELDVPALDGDGAENAEQSKRDGKKHF